MYGVTILLRLSKINKKEASQPVKTKEAPGANEMNSQEQSIIKQERSKIKAFLSALRTESSTISQELAGLVTKIAKLREAQLGIDEIINQFEEKLGK